jgi:hypothetical protein
MKKIKKTKRKIITYKILFLFFTLAGVLFSGYMSFIKLFSKTCAFGETCPLFMGFSACYFGFLLFLTLFILSLILATKKHKDKILTNSIFFVSLLGFLFAFYYSAGEMPLLIQNGFGFYKFGLPTCMLGFLFFLIIFILSIKFKKKVRHL